MRVLFFFSLAAGCGESSPSSDSLPAARTCSIGAADIGSSVSAVGTTMVDEDGRILLLRGMNTGGRSKFAPFLPFAFTSDADFDAALGEYWDRMAEWGFSVARLVFTWEAVEPTAGEYDETFLARYEAMIDAAWARGIRVIVDFHQDVYARMYCGDGFPEWTIPAELRQEVPADCSGWFSGYLTNANVRAAFDRFWTNADGIQDAYFAMFDMLVARLADRPGVIGFEAINEPGWGTSGVEDWERDVLGPFFATFADRVHAAAPDTLVFLDTPGIDGLSTSTAIEDPGVPGAVFAPHFYDPSVSLTGEYEADGSVEEAIAYWAETGTAWDVPVFLGEFGADHSTVGVREYLSDVLVALDAHEMGGSAWEYSTSGELWSQEDFSLVEADGTERTEVVDGLVRPYVRAVAGTDLVQTWDPATQTLAASFVPEPEGTTEVALPDRTYGGDPSVRLAGGCADVDPANRVVRIRADPSATTIELEIRPR